MEKNIWKHIQSVKQQSPLVHNITNYVVMYNTANALLAAGASPIMAHAKSEVRDMVAIAHSLVINIGTLDEYWADAMLIAAETAHISGKPWVLDPVGAGATPFRDDVVQQLLQFKPTVIRGNASEIMALGKVNKITTKGVDSTAQSSEAIATAKTISARNNAVVCISGATDIIVHHEQNIFVKNGHYMMTKVTGLGCTASALVGAFVGVVVDKIEATVAAMALLGIAGELAAQKSEGPGDLQLKLLNKLYNITEDEFLKNSKIFKL